MCILRLAISLALGIFIAGFLLTLGIIICIVLCAFIFLDLMFTLTMALISRWRKK